MTNFPQSATVIPYTPLTPHPTPYTLHPTPYTLHPTPYTLHPTPYTLGHLQGESIVTESSGLMSCLTTS